MSKKVKVLKYKIVNTNIDKKFIGKSLDLERVKSKGGPGSDGGRKPGSKNRMTLDKLAKIVTDGFNNVNHRIDTVQNRIDTIVKVNNLKE